MNIPKIIAALEQTDQLNCMVFLDRGEGESKCALGQLFLAAGKTRVEIRNEVINPINNVKYHKYFDGLLFKEYEITEKDCDIIIQKNDEKHYLPPTLRYIDVHDWFESLLIDELIAEVSEIEIADEIYA